MWLAAQHSPLDELRDESRDHRQRRGEAALRARQARDVGEHREELSHRQVLAATDIAAALSTVLQCAKVALGEVVDVCDVHRGVHVPRHSPVQVVEYNFARRRWSVVKRAVGHGRQYQDDWRSLGGESQHFVLGDILRLLVVPVQVRERYRRYVRPPPARRRAQRGVSRKH